MESHGHLNLSEFDIRSLVEFIELLTVVHNREVSSPKVISNPSLKLAEGRLDKLIFKLPQNIQMDWLITKCQTLKFRVEARYLKDKKYYLSIFVGHLVLDCLLGSPRNKEIFQITVNPGKLSTYSRLESLILNIFGEESLDSKIYRIDFCVDYRLPYLQVIEGLDVRDKQARIEHIDRPGRTGIQIGVNDDKIIVYDKAKESGLSGPLTRIERQIRGEKMFIKTMRELRVAKEAILQFSPMAIVSLNHIHLLQDRKKIDSEVERFNELKTLIQHEGYFSARKKLSIKNSNFERDYGKFISKVPYDVQPSEVLEKTIKDYYTEVMQ